MVGVADYNQWTSNQTDSLDYIYSSHNAIPGILKDFATMCVSAAVMNNNYCPFAVDSLKLAADPFADLNNRIEYVINNLTTNTYIDPSGKQLSLLTMTSNIRSSLGSVEKFSFLAQYVYLAESLIKHSTPVNLRGVGAADTLSLNDVTNDIEERSIPVNITSANYNSSDPFTGDENSFVWPAVVCLDQNNPFPSVDAFVNKWANQTQQNSLVGFLSNSMALCLGWPNLTAYDVERVSPLEFPKNLSNKMLVIGVTDDPVTPYHSALSTYSLIGSGNANFHVHDAMGHCSIANPNNCTTTMLTNYFTTGNLFLLDHARNLTRYRQPSTEWNHLSNR